MNHAVGSILQGVTELLQGAVGQQGAAAPAPAQQQAPAVGVGQPADQFVPAQAGAPAPAGQQAAAPGAAPADGAGAAAPAGGAGQAGGLEQALGQLVNLIQQLIQQLTGGAQGGAQGGAGGDAGAQAGAAGAGAAAAGGDPGTAVANAANGQTVTATSPDGRATATATAGAGATATATASVTGGDAGAAANPATSDAGAGAAGGGIGQAIASGIGSFLGAAASGAASGGGGGGLGGMLGGLFGGHDPLMFDLDGKGAGFDTNKKVASNLEGQGVKQVNDLKSGTGLLTFDATPQDGNATTHQAGKGELSHTFGNNTDLSAYGIKGDRPDGTFSNGFAALRAAGEKFGMIRPGKEYLDGNDLKQLESKIGLKMRTGGLNGQDKSLGDLGISRIDLGKANTTESKTQGTHDANGNILQHQQGANFTINGQQRGYVDGWFHADGERNA
ncbi:MAG TPA: hypothetical protein VND93_30535 [Myxococcales bacterium]|nr:hypothetical protein [Myxococcales bacterium]